MKQKFIPGMTVMIENMNDKQKKIFIEHYASLDTFKYFLKNAASEKIQKSFAKVVERYGRKEATENSQCSEVIIAYQRCIGNIQKKLASKIGMDVNSFEVRKLIGEYNFVAKQLYQMDDITKLLLEIAKDYKRNSEAKSEIDAIYSTGSPSYIGKAIEALQCSANNS